MNIKFALSLCMLSFLLTSCAIYRTTTVSDAEKVSTDIFDGVYVGTYFNKSARQTRTWNGTKMISNCRTFNLDVTWRVDGGVLKGVRNSVTNVDSEGGFYIKGIPTELSRVYTISGVKKTVPVTLTVMGKIEQQKLAATVYMVTVVNNLEDRSCRSYVELER